VIFWKLACYAVLSVTPVRAGKFFALGSVDACRRQQGRKLWFTPKWDCRRSLGHRRADWNRGWFVPPQPPHTDLQFENAVQCVEWASEGFGRTFTGDGVEVVVSGGERCQAVERD